MTLPTFSVIYGFYNLIKSPNFTFRDQMVSEGSNPVNGKYYERFHINKNSGVGKWLRYFLFIAYNDTIFFLSSVDSARVL